MTQTYSPTPDLDPTDFLLYRTTKDVLRLRRVRAVDTALASVFSVRLDRELASGRSPDSSWLRAVRARRLASRADRDCLAAAWEHAAAPSEGGRCRTQIPRDGLGGPRDGALIGDLVSAVQSDRFVSVRGLAMAWALLRDGGGPLYRRQGSEELACTLSAILRHLVEPLA